MSEEIQRTDGRSPEIVELEKRVPADRLASAIEGALEASAVTKGGAVIPDYRTRLAAAELVLAYTVGRPTQRTETVNVNMDAMSGADMVERLVKSPALREQLRAYLLEADERVLKEAKGRVVE